MSALKRKLSMGGGGSEESGSSGDGSEGASTVKAAAAQKTKKGVKTVDYVRDLGQARAVHQLKKWLTEHEGPPPEWVDAANADGRQYGKPWTPEELKAAKDRQAHKKGKGKQVAFDDPVPRPTADKWWLDIDTGCWLLTSGVGASGYGVCKLQTNEAIERQLAKRPEGKKRAAKGKGRQTWESKDTHNFQWHILAYLAKTGRNIEGDASHLCGRSNCFNFDHIVDEDRRKNLARIGCWGEIWCMTHDHLVLDMCVHEPSCIQPYVRDDLPNPLDCCRTAAEESARADGSQQSSRWNRSAPPTEGTQVTGDPLGSDNIGFVSSPAAPPIPGFMSSPAAPHVPEEESQQEEGSQHSVPPERQQTSLRQFFPRQTEDRGRASMAARNNLLQREPSSLPGAEGLRNQLEAEEEDSTAGPVAVLSNEEYLEMFVDEFDDEIDF